MSIRLKLILSNIAMTLIPIVASIILAIIIIANLILGTGSQTLKNQDIHQREIFKEYRMYGKQLITNPQQIKNLEFLKKVDASLKKFDSTIVVTKEKHIYYSSKITQQDFDKTIKDAPDYINHNLQINSYSEVLKEDFETDNKEIYTLYVFSNLQPLIDFGLNFLYRFIIGLILIILITNGVLTYLISRGILKPLKKLKAGAESIKEGNLSFSVADKSRNEFGEVLRAFEEMRQRLKESLEQQMKYDENRNEFLESITHDLKTPITSIKGYVEGLKDGIADTPEKTSKYIDTIYKKAVDMDKLINDLTFYSNQRMNKIPFNFSKVHLKNFIDDIVEEYQLELEGLGITIESLFQCDDTLKVKADIEKLKRVVANLIENSKKYNDKENGKITLTITTRENKAIICIEDTGEGISEENLPFIFERFYRADPARNSAKGGSGLGLSIAKQIIQEHGGNIWAESKYNVGTKIYFELEIITGDENE